MRELEFSARARRNLRSILLYSLKQWGTAQADSYQRTLERSFMLLRENPMLGTVRDDVRPDWRVLNVEHHRIIYRYFDEKILVLQILHERMDIGSRSGY